MKSAARILIPLLAALALQPGLPPGTSVVDPVSAPASQRLSMNAETPVPSVEDPPSAETSITGGSDEQRALALWALQRYVEAGLELPVLQIHLSSDESLCNGNRGLFGVGHRPWRVKVCTEDRMVFLHELGHAWSEYSLTARQRAAYVEQRGMESWADPNTPWLAKGSEDAADTLAWGLLETPIRGMSPGGPLEERNEAFRLLTGIDSPRISE